MSTARMLRILRPALFRAWRAASLVETFQLPTSSMILTTAIRPSSRGRRPPWRSRLRRARRAARGSVPLGGGGRGRCRRGTARRRRCRRRPPGSAGASISMRGRGGRPFPLPDTSGTLAGLRRDHAVMVPVLDSAAVFSAVDTAEAVERTRDGFLRHAAGEWEMPPKLYVDAPPNGDFRAMPARGGGLAIVKWVTSFPGNPARGLPVVTGALLVSSDETGELLAILDTAAVTSLRTGAAAAVRRRRWRAPGPRPSGSSAAASTDPGRPAASPRSATAPASVPTRGPRQRRRLRPSSAGGPGRPRRRSPPTSSSRSPPGTRRSSPPTCSGPAPIWPCSAPTGTARPRSRPRRSTAAASSATSGSRLRRAASSPAPSSAGRSAATTSPTSAPSSPLRAPGRRNDEEITLFDSTGLAIQDLGIALAVVAALGRGDLDPPTVAL